MDLKGNTLKTKNQISREEQQRLHSLIKQMIDNGSKEKTFDLPRDKKLFVSVYEAGGKNRVSMDLSEETVDGKLLYTDNCPADDGRAIQALIKNAVTCSLYGWYRK